MMQERHDVFVGNLTFNVTEDQLREVFRFVGLVKNVRVVTDKESGKSKGFAFVEFHDANTALAAIKHLNGHELNSRKIVVGFPSHSNLREVAKQMGETFQGMGVMNNVDEEQLLSRYNAEQAVIQSVELHEAWDLLDSLKKMLAEDRRGNKLRAFVEENPQMVNAMYELEKRLGIVLPTHILMAQPKLPIAASTMPGNNTGSGMGWNANANNNMNNSLMYDNNNMNMNNNMWQQQQQLYMNQSDMNMNMGMNMGMDMNSYSNMNMGMASSGGDYYGGNNSHNMDMGGQHQPTRRSRFK